MDPRINRAITKRFNKISSQKKHSNRRSIHLTNLQSYNPSIFAGTPIYSSFENFLSGRYINSKRILSKTNSLKPGLRIGRLLGKGGYGEVYEVFCQNQNFALKIPRAPLEITKSYILNEIQKLEMLKKPGSFHTPNVIPFFFYWGNEKIPCYITHVYNPINKEFPDFANQDPIDPVHALELFYLVARALKYITSHHIVHNDVKPENIMFYQGIPILTDYGTARSNSEINEVEIERLLGRLHGTPVWLPPELISIVENSSSHYVYYNLGKVCQKTDIWGLGLILMKCLTGRNLFHSIYVKSHSVPTVFETIHEQFNQANILHKYRLYAQRTLYRLYGNTDAYFDEKLDINKIKKLIGYGRFSEGLFEKYNKKEEKEFKSGKYFTTKLLVKKYELMQRPRTDVEIRDFFLSSLFDLFDTCTASLTKRIKVYRLIDTLDIIYPGLQEMTKQFHLKDFSSLEELI